MRFKRATDVLTESCKHELISPTTLESLEPLPRLLDRSVKVCRDCRIPRFDGEQASNFRISAVMTTFSNPKGCVTVPGIGGCLLNSNPKFVEIQKTSTSDSYHYKWMPAMPLSALHLGIAVVLLVSKQHHNHDFPLWTGERLLSKPAQAFE